MSAVKIVMIRNQDINEREILRGILERNTFELSYNMIKGNSSSR
jgi:hypothetical protein